MAGLGTEKILGPKGVGLLSDDDKLSDAARNKFVEDVIDILTLGNVDGLGITNTKSILKIPAPIFPSPGPKIILNPLDNPSGESLFWFAPESNVVLSKPFLLDKNGKYQTLMIDNLYAPLVKMLNIEGSTPLGIINDPTIYIDLSKLDKDVFDIKSPDEIGKKVIPKLGLILGELSAVVATAATGLATSVSITQDKYGIGGGTIKDVAAIFVSPPNPPTSLGFPVPEIPKLESPNPSISGLEVKSDLTKFAEAIFKIPSKIIGESLGLVTAIDKLSDPSKLISTIIGLISKIIITILESLGLLTGIPKLLLATLMVIVKNLAFMLLCVVIGKLLGTGILVKIFGSLGGLI